MKLRNKKTGEIIEAESCNNTGGCISIYYEEKDGQIGTKDCYSSLAELNKEWEDYEEPIVYWLINPLKEKPYRIDGNGEFRIYNDEEIAKFEEAGFLYKTEEEAEKAVEKLKAWKRLKDKGFEFEWVDKDTGSIKFAFFNREGKITKEMWQDIDLLFGGEE